MNVRLAVTVSLLLSGCAASPVAPVPSKVLTNDEASINILNFQSLSVEERFSKAIANGDARFLGIYGYALTVPGVPAAMLEDRSTRTVLPIAGTHDGVSSQRELQLNKEASRYAESYNALVLKHKSGIRVLPSNNSLQRR